MAHCRQASPPTLDMDDTRRTASFSFISASYRRPAVMQRPCRRLCTGAQQRKRGLFCGHLMQLPACGIVSQSRLQQAQDQSARIQVPDP